MIYLLDTNVCVDYLTGRYSALVERLQRTPPGDVALSSIVMAELRYVADKSQKRSRNHRLLDQLADELPNFDFDSRAASEYGRLRSRLERQGRMIGPNDALIAAHSLALGAVLVTDNESEFRRVAGLKIENWRL